MKVYLAQLVAVPAQGNEAAPDEGPGWCAPWTVAAIQSCSRAHLAQVGALVADIESADVVLLDLVDHLAEASREALASFRLEASAVGAQLIIRLHGAWRHGSYDYLDAEGADLDCVWGAADAVLVATRNHLVRLASFGGIDAAKTRLAPVAFDGLGGELPAPGRDCDRTKLLVAGETHRTAMSPVLEMLAEVDPQKATFKVVHGLQQFQEGLVGARALLVPALASFGDRSLVDAALRAGVTVITSPFAGAMEAPLPRGVVVVAKVKSSAGWRAALERGLAMEAGQTPEGAVGPPVVEDTCARQEEILRSIWAQRSKCSGGTAA